MQHSSALEDKTHSIGADDAGLSQDFHSSALEEKIHSIGADDAGLVKSLDRRGNLLLLSI